MKVFNLYYNIWNVNVNFITLVDVTNIVERVKNFSIYIYPYIYIWNIFSNEDYKLNINNVNSSKSIYI